MHCISNLLYSKISGSTLLKKLSYPYKKRFLLQHIINYFDSETTTQITLLLEKKKIMNPTQDFHQYLDLAMKNSNITNDAFAIKQGESLR